MRPVSPLPAAPTSPEAAAASVPASAALEERRQRDRDRQRRTRERRRVRRQGGAVVELHLTWGTLHALRKLGLLEDGASTPEQVARALTGYLSATMSPLADMSRRFQAL